MKKRFKIGTALAFSILFNLTSVTVPNVYAEEKTNNTEIVEEALIQENYYAEEKIENNAAIIEEPLLEKDPIIEEQSTADANNVVEAEPIRGPTSDTKDGDAENEEPPVEPKVILHITDTMGRTHTDIIYPYSGGTKQYKITDLLNNNNPKIKDGFIVPIGNKTYTFEGWYDQNGNRITEEGIVYGDGQVTLTLIPAGSVTDPYANSRPNGIKLKTTTLTTEVEITLHANFTFVKEAILHANYIDNVGNTGTSWDSPEGMTADEPYTHTFANPEEVQTATHGNYDFLYWQFQQEEGQEPDEQLDYNKQYEPGDSITYNFDEKPDGWEGTITAYAWWQPYVKLGLYSYKSNFNNNSRYSYQTDPIKVDLYGGELTSEPTRPGYRFTGWYDFKTDELVTETTFYSPDPSYVEPNKAEGINVPREINLYAGWERIEQNITITKTWNDTNNEKAHRPEEITVNVYASNQEEVYKTLTLTGDNTEDTWTSESFLVYPYDKEGNEITYTISEVKNKFYNSNVGENGLVIDTTKEITEITNTIKADGIVTVRYVDEYGNEIKPSTEIKETQDYEYHTTPLEIDDYRYVGVDGEENGIITDVPKEVIYHYAYNVGTIIVHYVDGNGNTITQDKNGNPVTEPELIKGVIGESYTENENIKPIEIEGYKNTHTVNTDNTGKFTKETIHITHIYEKVGKLIVKYLEEGSNEPLADEFTDTGFIGTTYVTKPVSVALYHLVNEPENATGEYSEEDTIVTYFYAKDKGNVIVHYYEKDTTTKVSEDVEISGYIGEEYTTTEAPAEDVAKYDLVATPENATGNITEESIDNPIEVIYYYVKHTGKVITHYVDVEDNDHELQESTTQEGKVDDEYNTTLINNIDIYSYVSDSGNTTGLYTEEDINVYYYYQKDSGSVEAIYIDALTGEEIADRYTDHNYVDQTYTTPQKEITGYDFLRVEGETTGNFIKNETIKVTYLYTAINKGHVVVKYLDEADDAVLAEEVEKSGTVGDEYTTTAADVEGYVLVNTPENAFGRYTEESITNPIVVIYYYTKPTTKVITHYVDIEDNSIELVEADVQTGKVGQDYTTTKLDNITNYTYVSNSENITGKFDYEDIDVYYYYQKDSGSVEAIYIDALTGEEIEERYTDHNYVDQTYTTPQKEITGYDFLRVEGETTGNFVKDETIKVTYYYKEITKKGNVIVKYLDVKDDSALADEVAKSGIVGEEYTTQPADISGYSLVKTPDNAYGRYTEESVDEPIIVIYYYGKNGIVYTHHVDINGNIVKEDDIQYGTIGDEYETTPVEVEDLVVVKTPDNATGTYQDEPIHVIYVYGPENKPEDEEKTGYVIVHYISDETPLADDVIIPGKVGDEFITQTKAFDGYKLVNIRKEVQPTRRGITPDYMANAYGTIVEGVTVIWYEYEAVEGEEEKPVTGTVIAHYVDENGNAIANDEFFYGNIGDQYYTSQKVISGYTGSKIPENRVGTIESELTEVFYEYTKNEEQEEPSSCDNNCCCNNCCSCNNNSGSEEETPTQPIINIDITINNDNSTEVNNENNNQDENTNNNEAITGDTNVDNNTNVETGDNNISNTNEQGDVNITTGDNVNNNTNNSESNSEGGNASTGDNNITVETGDNNLSTGDTNIENNSVNEANPQIENNTTIETGDTTTTVETGDVSNTNNTNVETGDNTNTTTVEGATATTGEINNSSSFVDGDNDNNNNTEIKDNTIANEVGDNTNTNTSESNPTISVDGGDNSSSSNVDSEINNEGPTNTSEIDNNPTNTNDGENTNNNEANNTGNTPSSDEDEGTSENEENGIVIANYLDEDGKVIASSVLTMDKVDEEYETNQKDIKGYDFVNVEGDPTGKYKKGVTTVNYYYQTKATPTPEPEPETEKTGKVIAHYVDIRGNMIGYDKSSEGKVNEDYETITRNFRGYELVQIVGKKAGKYQDGTIEVTYIYQKLETKPDTNPDEEINNNSKENAQGGTASVDYRKTYTGNEIKVPNTGLDYDNSIYTYIIVLISFVLSVIAFPISRHN